MKIINSEEYEEIGLEFQYELASLLNKKLTELGIEKNLRKNVCEDFIFDCSMLFDNKELNVESKKYQAKICFSNKNNLLIPNNEFSYHECVFGIIDEIFEEE